MRFIPCNSDMITRQNGCVYARVPETLHTCRLLAIRLPHDPQWRDNHRTTHNTTLADLLRITLRPYLHCIILRSRRRLSLSLLQLLATLVREGAARDGMLHNPTNDISLTMARHAVTTCAIVQKSARMKSCARDLTASSYAIGVTNDSRSHVGELEKRSAT